MTTYNQLKKNLVEKLQNQESKNAKAIIKNYLPTAVGYLLLSEYYLYKSVHCDDQKQKKEYSTKAMLNRSIAMMLENKCGWLIRNMQVNLTQENLQFSKCYKTTGVKLKEDELEQVKTEARNIAENIDENQFHKQVVNIDWRPQQ